MKIERRGPGLLIRYSEEEKKADPAFRLQEMESRIRALERQVKMLRSQVSILKRVAKGG